MHEYLVVFQHFWPGSVYIYIYYLTTFRCDIKEGDKILFTNIRKLKKMPKTKNQGKYVGPFTASKIMDSHVVISHEELGSNKDKKVPIHITRSTTNVKMHLGVERETLAILLIVRSKGRRLHNQEVCVMLHPEIE